MTESALTVFGVIVGAIITVFITSLNNRSQTQKELQDYRKSLMQQYLECLQKFDDIVRQMKSEGLVYKYQGENMSQTTQSALNMAKHADDLRSLIIRASSLLKATGDTELAACGWVLSYEALANTDTTGLWFNAEEYNPITYFRVGLEFGLDRFAGTIANNRPPSKKGSDMEINETLREHFRKVMIEKYKKDLDWAKRFETKEALANHLVDEIEKGSHYTDTKSEGIQSTHNS